MLSNYFFTNRNKTENVNLLDKDKVNIYSVLSNCHKVYKKININLHNFCHVNFYLFIIANNSRMQIDIFINQHIYRILSFCVPCLSIKMFGVGEFV